ncbi:hypothetical protein HUA76_14770 [Myxococcus sp. CA056]|uniref:site-2 protease family protein n=1 Tax=unclassified Myxococcus TaxID=2648731 RepID=UPI00157A7888|nr:MULTISPECIES: site-2 protease family protein [unclassified Myxococcus]NTX12060.1 hypothetical protein [Myxococcus sp. CA056]NTX33075.1 hypothetical protein [Myxococcus sp. CA033]NTX57617.1 hypothetical protein [Myxococcus sp. CA039A]
MERAALLFWLWMLAFAVTALWALSQAAVASSFGVRPTLVKLGYGPNLVTLSLGGIQWALHPLIPLGSSVRFNGPPEDAPTEAPADNRLHQLPLVLHAATIILPWALLVVVAMACLGAGEGLSQFLTGFTVPFQYSRLPDRIERFVALLRHGELLQAWGLASAKVAAINLLPMPILAGGSLLALPWRKQRERLPVWAAGLNLVTLLILLPWAGYALYLFGAAIFR